MRWRLRTGLVLETVRRGLRSLTRFAVFCDRTGVNQLVEIDRDVLECYLADLHAELAGHQRHGDSIGQLGSFLQTVRIHRWAPTLSATAMLFHEDYPKRPELLPRALSEHVMAQIEHVDNLDQWNNNAHQLVTVILIRCGLRVSDALRLPHDCVVLDADQAPYVRYFNHKMKREALVPIDEDDGAVADAAWAKQRIGRASQALPNGFCGLPVQKSCPHANACLTCPMFITTPEFLPQHRQQRTEVHQIISAAQARGQRRLIEMNQQVSDNLDVIITALEAGPDDSQKAAHDS